MIRVVKCWTRSFNLVISSCFGTRYGGKRKYFGETRALNGQFFKLGLLDTDIYSVLRFFTQTIVSVSPKVLHMFHIYFGYKNWRTFFRSFSSTARPIRENKTSVRMPLAFSKVSGSLPPLPSPPLPSPEEKPFNLRKNSSPLFAHNQKFFLIAIICI